MYISKILYGIGKDKNFEILRFSLGVELGDKIEFLETYCPHIR